LQFHDHGPEPKTVVEVPPEQRLVVGADEKVLPLELPQAPIVTVTLMFKVTLAVAVLPCASVPYTVIVTDPEPLDGAVMVTPPAPVLLA
jgi:hypothetical protein